MFRLYYDGALAHEGWHGSSIRKSDCTGAGEELTFGHDTGSWSWASEVELYDVRMYKHKNGSPLQHSDIFSIAFEPTPPAAATVFANAKCLQITDPAMEDQSWKDVFGNSCDWYHKHRKSFPELCAGQDVRNACPQACQSKFECYRKFVHPKPFFVFDRIKKIEPKVSLRPGLMQAFLISAGAQLRTGLASTLNLTLMATVPAD